MESDLINSDLTHHTLSVDSRDRNYATYPSPSRYRLDLPVTYYNVTSVRLISCEIPQTFFVFSAALGNVSMVVSLYDVANVVRVTRTVVIPDGNYTLGTIASAVTSALDSTFAQDGATFAVGVNPVTLKLTIACVQNRSIVIDTTPTNVASSAATGWGLGYNLGFNKNEIVSGSYITCPRVVSLNPYTYILLDIDGLGRIDECSIDDPGNGGTVFAKIPITDQPWGVVTANGINACISSRRIFRPPLVQQDRLYIQFRFHDGTLVDFNNVEHSFTLEFSCEDRRGQK